MQTIHFYFYQTLRGAFWALSACAVTGGSRKHTSAGSESHLLAMPLSQLEPMLCPQLGNISVIAIVFFLQFSQFNHLNLCVIKSMPWAVGLWGRN